MIKNILEKVKSNWDFILLVFLWLCVWATYDTDIGRFFQSGFPHGAVDLVHGLRSLLPLIALIIAIFIILRRRLLNKSFFVSPLGFLLVYAIVGIFASIFSKNPLMALYWGLLYGTVMLVLLIALKDKELLKKIIKINWIIAGILAIGLTLFFFVQPGAVKSITFNFLVCSQRPYEGMGGGCSSC